MSRRRRRYAGGPAPTPGTDAILIEAGDLLLKEDGDRILLESGGVPPPAVTAFDDGTLWDDGTGWIDD